MRLVVLAVLVSSAFALPATAAAPAGLIVFSRTDARFEQAVFSIRPDGSARDRLPSPTGGEGQPVISHDGRLIASVDGGAIVIRARGGPVIRRIRGSTTVELQEPSWGPGSRWIAVLTERCDVDPNGRSTGPLCADLSLVRRDGRFRRRLVNSNVATSDLIAQYAWSPDGRSIVFERYDPRGLAIVDVRTGAIRAVPGVGRRGAADPAWARSGWIVFARQRGPFRGSDVYAVRPSGRSLHRVCRAQNAMRATVSDDGRRVAFLDFRPTPDQNVWLVRVAPLQGGRCRGVGRASAEWTLSWSPDGTRLLWENEGARLVVGRADGSRPPRALTRGTLADWG
jgi:Tol biopolymer transport system component